MRIVAIADIVMSLDNVIAIAASAEVAAARVDLAHAAGIKTTLIIFGLATSVPLIVAGSAILMALLKTPTRPGSVAMMSPATQPSNAPPPQTSTR